tara:strand:- start:941 stop:1852 length:912 start_codon:yes stop_codon:yes gene_type:complete
MEEALQQENTVETPEVEGEIVELDSPAEASTESTTEPVAAEEPPVEEVAEVAEVETTDEDELTNYSEKVQKRINTLTRKLREAERGQESAARYAQDLQKQNIALQSQAVTLQESNFTETENRLKSQKAQTLAALKEATQNADHEKVAEANDVLAQIAAREIQVQEGKQRVEYQKQVAAEQPQTEVAMPAIHPDTQQWLDDNPWFLNDTEMRTSAQAIDKDLIQEGYVEGSSAYFKEVDKRIREVHPEKFGGTTTAKPQQKVASANRTAGQASGKRQVKLSPSEVAMAKKLNVPLKEYAKYVKR